MSRILLDMVKNLLAVVVVLVEPAHHLIGRHQVGGAERFPQSRLEDRCQMSLMESPKNTRRKFSFAHQRPLPLIEHHQQALKTHKKSYKLSATWWTRQIAGKSLFKYELSVSRKTRL